MKKHIYFIAFKYNIINKYAIIFYFFKYQYNSKNTTPKLFGPNIRTSEA
jgi:hypothetical protein